LFLDDIEKVANIVKSIIKNKKVKIISHYDTDGLTSAAIIAKMLLREGVNFEIRIVKRLSSEVLEKLNVSENDFLIFTDLGSGQLNLLQTILSKTQILILDHHIPVDINHFNLFHLNPIVYGEEPISSSLLCYIFAKFFNYKNIDLVDLAIVGAIADEQEEKWQFKGLAKKVLEEAELIGKISIFKGLRLYGRCTRPIHKALAYSFDPFIPSISGSESQAVQFLSELNINVNETGKWKTLSDLTPEEQQKLASAIMVERLKAKFSDPEDIFGDLYTILGRPEEIQDAREFSTLLNACGRTENFDIAIRLCLGDISVIDRCLEIFENYKKKIGECLSFARSNIKETENAFYIFGEGIIPENIIGTITSIILKSNLVNLRKPIFGFAETNEGKLKISARTLNTNINIGQIITNVIKVIGGEGGGHSEAAGATIDKNKKNEFIELVEKQIGEKIGS